MDLRTYRARSLQEALRLVRADLGDDAAVLHTREVGAGLMRWFGRTEIEVTASNEVDVPSRLPAASRFEHDVHESIPEPTNGFESAQHSQPTDFADYRLRFRELLQQDDEAGFSEVDAQCSRNAPAPAAKPKLLATIRQQLHLAGVEEATSAAWLAQLQDYLAQFPNATATELEDRLLRHVEAEIPLSGPLQLPAGERRIVALVGPTGVGKTTTVAKLAAQFRLNQQRRVGLITIDTYRIAAVDQLKTYADIMNLPLEVASSPREMAAALAALADCQLVLIDTTGRSPRDAMRIAEQRNLLAIADPDEVHLVLSATSSTACQQLAMRAYASVSPTSLMLTKLDELPQVGCLAGLLRETSLPLSYTTHGQNVPDDIRAADRRMLARSLTGIRTAEVN
ncbi:Flagellar biosynthesis protein FlhF [Anatilimnocola aggregata]|uniref:Flagellar biosynthesis protein FlhF n=1 Tax=Anatilimnocola aggregata TaxID=2528021 RepID=A0A517YH96_9BACT|nr:flagellar biosynthesis protein FlhF [Anatilimnocola aggregata]QDU29604.1 Flagellar biosynthesis protein FlhF [Anatilimnocola aggregata]